MEINKKNRTELKNYFLANKIPTQQQFADLIDASFNQAEDGMVKAQGNPIALAAEGDRAGAQEVLHFFSSFEDENPNWAINLNPRVNAEVPGSNKPGFNIKDSSGQSQLFIKSGDGNVGIGTIEAAARLSIKGRNNAPLIAAISADTGKSIFEVSQEGGDGILNVQSSVGASVTRLSGNTGSPSFFLSKVGIGTTAPEANLHIKSGGAQLKITNTQAGISPHLVLQGSNSKFWDLLINEAGDDALEFWPNNNAAQKLILGRDGSLQAPGGVIVNNRTSHLNVDGAFYRYGNNVYLTVDDQFYIRDSEDKIAVRFNTNNGRITVGEDRDPQAPLTITGAGKENNPDKSMHISSQCILFGGNNDGKETNSAKISAGTHTPDSLNIVGMGSTNQNRKVDIWAEGGLTVRGYIKTTGAVAFSAYITTNIIDSIAVLPLKALYNIGNHFNDTTFKFTAPVKGLYLFTMTVFKFSSNEFLHWVLRLNDTQYVNGDGTVEPGERTLLSCSTTNITYSRTIITTLNAGDVVHIQQAGKGHADTYRSGLEGVLLHAL